MAKRVISSRDSNWEKPLLSLSFSSTPQIPSSVIIPDEITMEELSKGTVYGIVTSVFGVIDFTNVFASVFSCLEGIGFKPQQPCTIEGLTSSSEVDHINLCSVIEFAVSEKTLTVDMLTSDLKRLPRSFFVIKSYPASMIDAVALWLSKFPCFVTLPEIFKDDLQNKVANGSHIAGAISRIFPKRILKGEVMIGEELTNEEIEKNWRMISEVLDEIGAFILREQNVSEQLFMMFFADVFYTTRSGVKKFVKVDPPPIQLPPVVSRPMTAPVSIPGQRGRVVQQVAAPEKPQTDQKTALPPLRRASQPEAKIVRPGSSKAPERRGSALLKQKPVKAPEPVPQPKPAPVPEPAKEPVKEAMKEEAEAEPPKPAEQQTETGKPRRVIKIIKRGQEPDWQREMRNVLSGLFDTFAASEQLNIEEASKHDIISAIIKLADRKRSDDDYGLLTGDIRNADDKKIGVVFLEELITPNSIADGANLAEVLVNLAKSVIAGRKAVTPRVTFVSIPDGMGRPKKAKFSVDMMWDEDEPPSRGSRRRPPPVDPESVKVVPNIKTITNALKFNSLPGPANDKARQELMRLLQAGYTDYRIVLLMASRTQRFKGVYVLEPQGDVGTKVWGAGPDEVGPAEVGAYFKYDTSTKQFMSLAVNAFTQTTDGFSLKKKYEKQEW